MSSYPLVMVCLLVHFISQHIRAWQKLSTRIPTDSFHSTREHLTNCIDPLFLVLVISISKKVLELASSKCSVICQIHEKLRNCNIYGERNPGEEVYTYCTVAYTHCNLFTLETRSWIKWRLNICINHLLDLNWTVVFYNSLGVKCISIFFKLSVRFQLEWSDPAEISMQFRLDEVRQQFQLWSVWVSFT